MPAAIPLIAGAFLAAGSVATAVGLGTLVVAGLAISWAAVLTVTGVALLAVAYLARKTPKPESAGQQLQQKLDPQAPVPIAFGRTATGGFITWRGTWGKKNAFYGIVTVLSAGGPIAGIESYRAGDYPIGFSGSPAAQLATCNNVGGYSGSSKLYKGKLRQRWVPGNAPATDTPASLTGYPIPAGAMSGLAHSITSFEYNADAFPQNIPASLWTLNGVKLYDPRKDSTYPGGSGAQRVDQPATWTFSENPYLAALQWTLGRYENGKRVYGIGAKWSEVDVASFVNGANVADANGWKVGGVITTSDDKYAVLASLLTCGSGVPVARGAQIACSVNAPKTAVLTLTKEDIIGEVEISSTTSWRDRQNTIIPRYREESQNWEIISGERLSAATYVAEDGGETKTVEIEFPLVQQAAQAHQLAAYELVNSREFLTFTVNAKMRMLAARVGDAIMVNVPQVAASSIKCTVAGREFNPADLSVTLTLKSETDAKHAYALGQTQVAPPSPKLDGYDPSNPEAPASTAWAITATAIKNDTVTLPAIVVTGATDDPNAATIIFEYRPLGSSEWLNGGEYPRTTNRVELTSVTTGTAYEVAVSYRTNLNVIGERLILGATAGDMKVDWQTIVDGAGKPEDGATVGAPDWTSVGGKPVPEVISDLGNAKGNAQAAVDALKNNAGQIIQVKELVAGFNDLEEVFGNTVSSKTNADAAEAAKVIAQTASDNAAKALTDSQAARDAAQAAQGLASGSASGAATSASQSAQAKADAQAARDAAIQKANDAATSATNASGAATTATGQATIATQKADVAGSSASIANAKADVATTQAGEASVSSANAANSASSAAISQTGADQSASAAKTSETNAGTSAGTALTKASEASTSASDAQGSANSATAAQVVAASSAATATQAKTDAVTAKDQAAQSAVASAGSASLAQTSETNAGLSASAALASQTAANTSAGNAKTSSDQASSSATDALGSKNSAAISQGASATSEKASKDAATASADSASLAAASKNGAEQSASAANTSATNASTSEGKANTSASNASRSEQNALGSSQTASASQELAAQSSSDAKAQADYARDKALLANDYAIAANGSASTAGTKADAAGRSAEAANQSKIDAVAANGAALASAQAANLSAVNADASASTASTSASLSSSFASNAVMAVAPTIPSKFGEGKMFWRRDWNNGPSRASDLDTNTWTFANGGAVFYNPGAGNPDIAHLGAIPFRRDRKYRLTAKWLTIDAGGQNSVGALLYFIGMNGAYNSVTTPGKAIGINSGETGWGDGPNYSTATFDLNSADMASDVVFIRGLFRISQATGSQRFRLESLTIEDVTAETLGAKALADSATNTASISTLSDTVTNGLGSLGIRANTLEAKVATTAISYIVVSRGAQGSGPRDSGLYTGAGVRIGNGPARSYGLSVKNPNDDNWASFSYDIYGDANARAAMANVLMNIGRGQIVVVTTYDEPNNGHTDEALVAGMQRCGAGPLFTTPNFKTHGAYIFIGTAGAGYGGGNEYYAGSTDTNADAYLEKTFARIGNSIDAGGSGLAIRDVTARVSTTEGVLATIGGRTKAYLVQDVSAGNGRAIVSLRANGVTGSSNIDLAASQIRLINSAGGVLSPTLSVQDNNVVISGDLYMGAGRIVSNSGGFMKVQGTGFGTGNQFIEWFGPNMAISSCSEANARYYLKTDGSAYFGGTLSAGLLKNSVQTTSQAADAAVTTGTFGSNGKSRIVTVGYSATANSSITGGCPTPYTPYATVRLFRGNNASGTLLAEQQFNGSHGCNPGAGQFEPGNMDDSIGGSITYTDNTGGSSASYFVQLVARSMMTTNLLQSLGVTSVEQ